MHPPPTEHVLSRSVAADQVVGGGVSTELLGCPLKFLPCPGPGKVPHGTARHGAARELGPHGERIVRGPPPMASDASSLMQEGPDRHGQAHQQ